MFSRPFALLLAPWLTLYLLVVSIGLPLQRVYCACVGKSSLTLVGEAHVCERHAVVTNAPAVKAKPRHACCAARAACSAKTDDGVPELKHDCGDTDVLLAALDADFTAEDHGAAIVVGEIPPTTDPLAVWPQRPAIGRAELAPAHPRPPPLSGRDRLLAHQTFLI